ADTDQQPFGPFEGCVPPCRVGLGVLSTQTTRRYRHGGKIGDSYVLLRIVGLRAISGLCAFIRTGCVWNGRHISGWGLLCIGMIFSRLVSAGARIGGPTRDWWNCLHDRQEHSQREEFHNGKILTPRFMPHRERRAFQTGTLRTAGSILISIFASPCTWPN